VIYTPDSGLDLEKAVNENLNELTIVDKIRRCIGLSFSG